MKSLWQKIELPAFPKLEGDTKTDVLVIGGGMAGILTAYELTKSGVDCILAEQGRLASGNTGNTTAKITYQHGLIYDRLIREKGEEAAGLYLAANRAALAEYESLCSGIDCDFRRQDSYVYSADDRSALERETAALRKLGCPAEFTEHVPLPIPTVGAVRVPGQAQFHPLKFLHGIVGGLRIYEDTHIGNVRGTAAVTDTGTIRAEKIVFATHFPFIDRRGLYFLKLYQHRSYVLALTGTPKAGGMFVADTDSGLSFRDAGDVLLLGGGGGRTGKPCGGWDELRRFAAEHYPDAREEACWAAQDCMSLDSVPNIGRYSRNTPDWYVATGFNKWGMTGSMTAAMLIRDQILGRTNDSAEVFDPSRSILSKQLIVNIGESIVNLLTPTVPRCPHLGCALKWNPAEHSWDCPCHGSRFDESGEVLDNPSNGGLSR